MYEINISTFRIAENLDFLKKNFVNKKIYLGYIGTAGLLLLCSLDDRNSVKLVAFWNHKYLGSWFIKNINKNLIIGSEPEYSQSFETVKGICKIILTEANSL